LVLGEESSSTVFCFKLVLKFDLVVLSSKGISLSVLLPGTVHNNKVVFYKHFGPPSLAACKLLGCYEIFKCFIVRKDVNTLCCALKFWPPLV
jgi:hypothetical protein